MNKQLVPLCVLILSGVLFLFCSNADHFPPAADSNGKLSPFDKLNMHYAKTYTPMEAHAYMLGSVHNEGLDRCHEYYNESGRMFLSRELFSQLVSNAVNAVFEENGFSNQSLITSDDVTVLFHFFDELRASGIFDFFSRNPDYSALLRYMREDGYLTEDEHMEISRLFKCLLSDGAQRSALVIEHASAPETMLGAAAFNIMLHSIQYWNDRTKTSVTRSGRDGNHHQQTDDRNYDATLRVAGDVLGLLIASATGAGTPAAGGATIACSYIMELITNCMDHPPSLGTPCNNDISSLDYWDNINIPPPSGI